MIEADPGVITDRHTGEHMERVSRIIFLLLSALDGRPYHFV
jgi:hypothetical protein